jgi:hypothetical protein
MRPPFRPAPAGATAEPSHFPPRVTEGTCDHEGYQPSSGCWKDRPLWWRNKPCPPPAGDAVCRPRRGATAGGGSMSTRQYHARFWCGPGLVWPGPHPGFSLDVRPHGLPTNRTSGLTAFQQNTTATAARDRAHGSRPYGTVDFLVGVSTLSTVSMGKLVGGNAPRRDLRS